MPASPTATPPVAGGSVDRQSPVDARIRQTRTVVKATDVATGVGLLLAWTLVVLLIGAIADHWLVAGGFGRWGRFAVFGVGLAGAALLIATRIGPHFLRSINPLYAAREIEREAPELKNSLLNLLQVREQAGGAPSVRRALERQAADRLARVGDASIDRTPLVRVAQLLMAIVAVIGVYIVASPKDFFASAGRVLAPWSSIAAPSRVRIDNVEPGMTEVAQGERIEVAAMITGLADDEIAVVVYSTNDGRIDDRRVPLRAIAGRLRQSTSLPPAGPAAALGLQSNVVYRIEAGDARTPNYRVGVVAAPTIAPIAVRYEYPDYTGLRSREVEGVGDLSAIEGTRVTLTAQANLPIAAAQIDIDADGRPDKTMTPNGDTATAKWTLVRTPDEPGDTIAPYVIRFTSTDDRANNNPPQYRLEVTADLAPEATLIAPEEPVLEVGVDQRVRITAEARDPDFALAAVRLIGEVDGRRPLSRELLTGDGRGKFVETASVTPRELGLQPGQELTYWVAAADNRRPKPNTAISAKQRLRVVGPANLDANRGDQRNAERSGAGQPSEGSPEAENEQQQRAPAGGQQGGQDSPENQPEQGGAEDDSQQPNQQQQGPNGDNEEPNEQDPSGQRQPQPNGIRGAGEGEPGEGEQENQQGGSPSANQKDGPPQNNGAPPNNASDRSNGNQRSPSDRQPGQQGADQKAGDQQPNGEQGAEGQPGEAGSEEQRPVARDGRDDGEAFERIQDFLKNQQQDSAAERGKPQPDDANQRQNPSRGQEGDPRESASEQSAADDRQPPAGQEQRGDEGASPSDAGEAESEQADGTNNGDPEGSNQQGADGGQPQQREGAAGEQPDRENNASPEATGDPSGEQSGSRSSESGQDQPTGQTPDPQSGPREGTGDSGQNQPADRGAGSPDDRGEGDPTQRPGEQQTSDKPTGQPAGDNSDVPTGDGSRERPSNSQNGKPGGEPSDDAQSEGDGQGDRADDSTPPSGDAGSPRPPRPGEDRGDPAGLGDRSGLFDGASDGASPGGDEANLEYAREQTDLVLNRLEDLMKDQQVDQKMLDELGWSDADLRRFVERWRSLQQAAKQRSPQGKARLDERLRSLGKLPGAPTATRDVATDDFRDLRERARTSVPPRLRADQERYLRSLNRVGDE